MKKFRNTISLLLATVLLAGALCGCEQSSYDLLDQVLIGENEEITVRRLFECSEESLRYAQYLKVDCNCVGEDKAYCDKYINEFTYESYYQDTDNNVFILTGTYNRDSVVTIFDDVLKCDCDYGYYEGRKNGHPTHGFECIRQKNIGSEAKENDVSIDVNSILYPDLSAATVWIGGLNSNNQYVVIVTGDLSSFKKCFCGMDGTSGLNEIRYYFSADTHVLERVTVSGKESKTEKNNLGKEVEKVKTFSAEFRIKEISYKDRGIPYPGY